MQPGPAHLVLAGLAGLNLRLLARCPICVLLTNHFFNSLLFRQFEFELGEVIYSNEFNCNNILPKELSTVGGMSLQQSLELLLIQI